MIQPFEAYQETVRRVFAKVKGTASADELGKRCLPLGSSADDCLVPVCEIHARDEKLIAVLAHWRKINTWAYPTQFEVTWEGTRAWLRSKVLDAPDRILFLVESRGIPIGHVGLADGLNRTQEMKVDNVMRGEWEGRPGIMSQALGTMLQWAERTLAPRRFYLPVFTDNVHAISFYRRFGFQDDGLILLRRHEEDGRVSYRPMAAGDRLPPDRHHLIMTLAPLRRSWSAVFRNWWANGSRGKKQSQARLYKTIRGTGGSS